MVRRLEDSDPGDRMWLQNFERRFAERDRLRELNKQKEKDTNYYLIYIASNPNILRTGSSGVIYLRKEPESVYQNYNGAKIDTILNVSGISCLPRSHYALLAKNYLDRHLKTQFTDNGLASILEDFGNGVSLETIGQSIQRRPRYMGSFFRKLKQEDKSFEIVALLREKKKIELKKGNNLQNSHLSQNGKSSILRYSDKLNP